MQKYFRAKNATRLFDNLTTEVAYAPKQNLSYVHGGSAQLHNVLAETDSFEWLYDLSELWFTRTRWSLLVRQYLDLQTLDDWLNQIEMKMGPRGRGVAVMRTKAVEKRKNKAASWREWGACMLTLSYRSLPRPQITLHSRTTYLGGLGALDMSVAWLCAKMIGEHLNLEPQDMAFTWFIENAQIHGFKSLGWFLADPARAQELTNMNEPRDSKIAGYNAAKTWVKTFLHDDEQGTKYGEMPYAQTRRARKRFHTQTMGYDYGKPFEGGGHAQPSQNRRFKPLPHLITNDLNFNSLKKGPVKPSELVHALYVKENDR